MVDVDLVFFDMEGTVFRKEVRDSKGNTAPGAWTVIADELGEEAAQEEEETKEKWNNGEYSGYMDWVKDTIRVHQKHGLTREQFERIMETIEFRDGVEEAFTRLHQEGVKTVLVTGGFKYQAEKAQRELGIDHAFASCEYLWDEEGEIKHWNILPADYQGKVDFMELIMQEYSLEPKNCAFVGDGSNDIHLAKKVGTSISFNGAPDLEKAVDYTINQDRENEDFTEILEYM